MAETQIKTALILTAYDHMSRVVNESVSKSMAGINKLTKGTESFSKKAASFGTKSLLAGVAVGAGLVDFIKSAEESVQATQRLTTVFKQMKGESTAAAKGAADFSSKLMFKIGVDDEKIMEVQAKLGTFGNVINNTKNSAEVFNRATEIAFDMQALGLGDGTSNAMKLGKMLDNPLKSMNALSRGGIVFDKVEQKKIKSLIDSGKLFEAQQYMLSKLESKMGGVAAATAPASAKMLIAFGELKEQLGAALLPTFTEFSNKIINEVIPAVQNFLKEHGPLLGNVLKGAAAFVALSIAMSGVSFLFSGISQSIGIGAKLFGTVKTGVTAFSAAMGTGAKGMKAVSMALKAMNLSLLASPWFWLAIAAVAAVAAIIYYWDDISAFFSKLWDKVKQLTQAAWNWIKDMFFNYTAVGLVVKHWDKISDFFKNIWIKVKSGIKTAWDGIKNMFLSYTPFGLIIKHWDVISPMFEKVWGRVKGVFTSFVTWIKGLGTIFFTAGKNIVESIWNGIKALAMKPVEAIKNIVQSMRNYLPFSPAKVGPFKDLHRVKIVETIAQTMKPQPVQRAMDMTMNSVFKTKGAGTGVSTKSILIDLSAIVSALKMVSKGILTAVSKVGVSRSMQAISVLSKGGNANIASPNRVGAQSLSVSYSPSIVINGSSTSRDKQDIERLLRENADYLMRLIKQKNARSNYLSY